MEHNSPGLFRQIGIVFLFTLLSIAIHESGHFLVYTLADYPVKVTLQSVSPIGSVEPSADRWAKLAGPAASWVAALAFLFLALHRPGFTWATASLTNASIRVFPCFMDLFRAIQNGRPFSDEGDVAVSLTSTQGGRIAVVLAAIALSFVLMALSGRQYHFARRGTLKVAGIYFLSLATGIAVVLVDELIR